MIMDMRLLVKVPIKEATTPTDGSRVYANRYWTVMDECILFWRGFAPQCNSNEDIAKKVRDKLYPECDVRFFEVIYHKEQ